MEDARDRPPGYLPRTSSMKVQEEPAGRIRATPGRGRQFPFSPNRPGPNPVEGPSVAGATGQRQAGQSDQCSAQEFHANRPQPRTNASRILLHEASGGTINLHCSNYGLQPIRVFTTRMSAWALAEAEESGRGCKARSANGTAAAPAEADALDCRRQARRAANETGAR